jgi:hypothetical protein
MQAPGQPPKRQLSPEMQLAVVREVQTGARTLYVLGQIEYTDISGDPETKSFKYEYRPFQPTGGNVASLDRHVWTCDFEYIP